LTTSNEQVKTLKRKYTELNDKYNDVSASNIILRSQKETLIEQCDTLKAQNAFYKSSNDSRKKQK
jgi:archaellum component FlaC